MKHVSGLLRVLLIAVTVEICVGSSLDNDDVDDADGPVIEATYSDEESSHGDKYTYEVDETSQTPIIQQTFKGILKLDELVSHFCGILHHPIAYEKCRTHLINTSEEIIDTESNITNITEACKDSVKYKLCFKSYIQLHHILGLNITSTVHLLSLAKLPENDVNNDIFTFLSQMEGALMNVTLSENPKFNTIIFAFQMFGAEETIQFSTRLETNESFLKRNCSFIEYMTFFKLFKSDIYLNDICAKTESWHYQQLKEFKQWIEHEFNEDIMVDMIIDGAQFYKYDRENKLTLTVEQLFIVFEKVNKPVLVMSIVESLRNLNISFEEILEFLRTHRNIIVSEHCVRAIVGAIDFAKDNVNKDSYFDDILEFVNVLIRITKTNIMFADRGGVETGSQCISIKKQIDSLTKTAKEEKYKQTILYSTQIAHRFEYIDFFDILAFVQSDVNDGEKFVNSFSKEEALVIRKSIENKWRTQLDEIKTHATFNILTDNKFLQNIELKEYQNWFRDRNPQYMSNQNPDENPEYTSNQIHDENSKNQLATYMQKVLQRFSKEYDDKLELNKNFLAVLIEFESADYDSDNINISLTDSMLTIVKNNGPKSAAPATSIQDAHSEFSSSHSGGDMS